MAQVSSVAAASGAFLDVFLAALDEPEQATCAHADAALAAATDVPALVTWRPEAAELASVAYQHLTHVGQNGAARFAGARQQLTKLRERQDLVHFYFGRGVMVEQMWLG